MKYYSDGSEMVCGKFTWMAVAYDTQKPVIVEGQKRDIGGEAKWCAAECDFVISSEQCGKECPDYSPCNGKSGRCTELKACFVGTGIKYRITGRGSVRKVIGGDSNGA